MKQVTKLMINEFGLKRLKYDFMGFRFTKLNELSFHHLIIPKRLCLDMPDKGYYRDNGAILVADTSHSYLHTIERYDRQAFLEITKYLVEENKLGRLDITMLKSIREILLDFESRYEGMRSESGCAIVKGCYKDRISL